MNFIQEGDLYRVVKITGPTHNLLGLRFSEQEKEKVTIEILSNENETSGQHVQLDAEEVKTQVLRGVNVANARFATNYYVSHIQYISTDSPPAETYRELATSLVQRLVQNKLFTSTIFSPNS